MFGFAGLRRRRCSDVDIGLGFRFRFRRRRRIHNGGLLFLGRRIVYRRFFLLASREERGANQQANVFVHECWTRRAVDYLR
jgi:hypothetical protein